MNPIQAATRRHREENGRGIYSVCSAHPLVLRAAMQQAVEDRSLLLIEATSNQVDQFGGYTGMTPAAFRDWVHELAQREDCSADHLVLGGDHLGPNRWQGAPPEEAMGNAEGVVAAYAAAGYAKLHIDCSMRLAGDPAPLPDSLVADRAARLIAVAERLRPDGAVPPVYVIGSEVPVPGGAQEALGELHPTSPESARATIDAHRSALADHGLEDVWSRIVALVVQPGVEFDQLKVVDYRPWATRDLQRVLDDEPGLVYEAHSTDYQTRTRLARLVEDHWAILKVGPGLTFAAREALFALAAVETELLPEDQRSDLVEVVDRVMVQRPDYWRGYYAGTADEQRIARRYGYSDRIRYYWTDSTVTAAVERLLANLSKHGVPEPLLSQHLPRQFVKVREGRLAADPEALIIDAVREVLRDYAVACGDQEQVEHELGGAP